MNCRQARQYIFAFLDNELDAALSLEVQQHIEHCPHCARECEIENSVRRQLELTFQHTDPIPGFDESALVEMLRNRRPASTHTVRRARRFGTVGAAGAMAAALLLVVTVFLSDGEQNGAHVSLTDALVDDFDHFVAESKPLQFVSADANDVSQWLQERTSLAVRMPAAKSTVAELQGARKCKINGKPAAFAVYRMKGKLVSVVALQESDQALAAMKRIDRDGHTHWVDHCRGHTVLACSRGGLIYAIVSRLPGESLLALMPGAES